MIESKSICLNELLHLEINFFHSSGFPGCLGTLMSIFCRGWGRVKKPVAEFTAEFLTCYFLHCLRIDIFQFFRHPCVNCFLSALPLTPSIMLHHPHFGSDIQTIPTNNPIKSIYSRTMYFFDTMSKVCIFLLQTMQRKSSDNKNLQCHWPREQL